MKTSKILGIAVCLLLSATTFAQNWGGDIVGPFPQQQTLGTNNNRPFRFETNGIQRLHINQQFGANYQGVLTPGYIGIGDDPTDVRSRLTITGTNNTFFGGGGYRSWMKTGVTFTDNDDLSYMGVRSVGNGLDITKRLFQNCRILNRRKQKLEVNERKFNGKYHFNIQTSHSTFCGSHPPNN